MNFFYMKKDSKFLCAMFYTKRVISLLSIMAYHLRGILSNNFSAYSVDNLLQTLRIWYASCFKVKIHFPARWLLKIPHTFSIGIVSGDCEGQSIVSTPFSLKRTHFENVLLSHVVKAILNEISDCAIVLD